MAGQGAQDFDFLLIGDWQRGHDGIGLQLKAAGCHEGVKARCLCGFQDTETVFLDAQKHVLGNGQIRDQLQFLMHDGHPACQGSRRVPGMRPGSKNLKGAG